jgi:hypothetical protein
MNEDGSRHYPEKPRAVYFFGTCQIDLWRPATALTESAGVSPASFIKSSNLDRFL